MKTLDKDRQLALGVYTHYGTESAGGRGDRMADRI